MLAKDIARGAVVAVFVLLWGGCRRPEAASAASGARSVLLVTLDTTRWDHVGPYGAENVATPTLDALARDGILFENAFAVAPITLPAHTSILSGLYPPRHGVRNNGTHHAGDELVLAQESFKKAGYRTAAFVSAAVLDKRYGLSQGFEVYDDDLSSGRERHPRVVPDRPAEATVDAARRWLDDVSAEEPFFLWVHLYDPHAVYSPPPPFRDTYRDRLYDGEIAYADSQLARLLAHPQIEARANSLGVTVLADHGESLGEHGERTHGILPYDSTLRIPWVMRLPGEPQGLRVGPWVSQVDLLPTLLSYAGLPVPISLDGENLSPYWRGEKRGSDRPPLYSEVMLPKFTYGWAELRVVRRPPWKLIDAPVQELYDLHRDPRELTSVLEMRPGPRHDLNRDLNELIADADRESTLEIDLDDLAALQALGYVATGAVAAAGPRPSPMDRIGVHTQLERARMLINDRHYAPAEQVLRGVLAEDAGNLAAEMELGGVLRAQKRYEEALSILASAASRAGEPSNMLVEIAVTEQARGEHKAALRVLERVLARNPRYVRALLVKARSLAASGEQEALRSHLEAAIAAHPDSAPLRVELARLVRLPDGDLEAGERLLRAALDRDPFITQGWMTLAAVQKRRGQSEAAVGSYRAALQRAPDHGPAHGRLGLLLARMGRGKDAEPHLREAIRLADEFRPELHVSLGAWLAESGRAKEAEDEYARVLAVEPTNPAVRNNQAIADYRLGRLDDARTRLEILVKEFPKHADAHANLAAIAVDQRRWADAERHARAALEVDPRQLGAHTNLGVSLDERGKFDEAIKALRDALSHDESYWQARLNLGVSLRKKGDLGAAREELSRVLREHPGVADVHYELGLVSAEEGKEQEARRYFASFLKHPTADKVRVTEVKKRLEGKITRDRH